MGTGASRPRKERALQKYVKAAETYDRLHNRNSPLQLNNIYRSGKSRKALTWRQKLVKGTSNLFNRVRHLGRRSNTAKIRSAKRKAAEKLDRAEHQAFIANQQNEASAKEKLNRTVRGMTQRQKYNAAATSFRNQYNNVDDLSYPSLPGEPHGQHHRMSFIGDYMNAWPHTREVEREFKKRRNYNTARRSGAPINPWLGYSRFRPVTARGVSI